MRERNVVRSTESIIVGACCGRDRTMRKFGLAAVLAASVATTGCASYGNGYGYDPYYGNNGYYQNGYTYDSQGRRIATGAVGGAVAGGIAGAVIPGVSVGEGALAGAVLGGVLGAV